MFDPAPAGSTPGAPISDANGSPILKGGQLQFPWGQLTVSTIEPFPFAVVGKPAVNALLVRRMVSRVGFIGPNQTGSTSFNGSQAKCGTAPAAAVTLTLALNGNAIGTVAFAAGSKVATCTTTSGNPVYVVPGDILTLTTSATADAAFSDPIGFIAMH
ncbi:hypothetical protein [Methylobacterium sp. J-090]|uniref:hypothetical protein n=1 Tax=Methylobacterium sp. J-090 TaxID=2836666 RepID=UPI001FB8E8C2|nr:hypothetical protein [Methylobacterium sp. J-090]MCJ2081534.1 hypothetical protein [Methylobacterium sp. J-090]